ncbi:class I SAM-dependent methyltransferase [Deinococcus cellulosilyticus]|uniref:Methyltransferase n=1 Tax=Deinococcus cellulosilyticus (strain DSM 18568 / NBRC 106333 / KACC 11606 / 5516J-15) TaxID=1223518 RepID=A0A511MZU1_DEIC1|nr:class I SAM-dependent methyltransferase [Deinococcus cellulosilyticus]GEM46103.1 methyltransferase [Deinococcus cellulosilyticus NBRC 106333 = KACC 11606]
MHTFARKLAGTLDRLTLGKVPTHEQYRLPRGLTGFFIGGDMMKQHSPETLWTLSLMQLKPDSQVLEIGPGAGALLGSIAEKLTSGQVTGLDLSHSMVQMAWARNLRHVSRRRVNVLQGNAMSLPFKDQHFDEIVSVHSLYFWPDPEKVLSECLRVLKPRGRLILTFMPRNRWPNEGQGATCHVFSAEEVAALMRKAGFSHTEVVPGEAHFRECAVIGAI